MKFRIMMYTALFISVATLASCGGGGGSSALSTISGSVVKGPVIGNTVNIYTADGKTLLVANVPTDANGNWSVTLSTTGPVLAISTGGTYVDEATGNIINAGTMQALFNPATSTSAPITPISNALTQTALAMVTSNTAPDITTALVQATTEYQRIFGFNPLTTMPLDPANLANATAAQKQYAAILGGISQLASNTYSAAVVGDPTVTPFSVVDALIKDFGADGVFDGKGAAGASLTVGNNASITAALPGGGGAAALQNAMTQYLAGAMAPAQLAPANFTAPTIATPNLTALLTPAGNNAGGNAGGGGTTGLTVSGILPTSGAVGSSVTISGSGFNKFLGVSVLFNGSTTPATITTMTATQLIVTVPAGATTGTISVQGTPGGTPVQTSSFTVTGGGTGATGGAGGTLTVTGGASVTNPAIAVPGTFTPTSYAAGTPPLLSMTWSKAGPTLPWTLSLSGNLIICNFEGGLWSSGILVNGLSGAGVALDLVNGTVTFTNVTLNPTVSSSGSLVLNGTLTLTPVTGTAIAITGTGTGNVGSGFDAPVAVYGNNGVTESWRWNSTNGVQLVATRVLVGGSALINAFSLTLTSPAGPMYFVGVLAAGVVADTAGKTMTITNIAVPGAAPTTTSVTLNGVLTIP